jgi:regulator of RNase E activity RraB
VLFPSPEEMQTIKNRWVVDELEKGGDPLTTPRDISHWIYFRSDHERSEFFAEVEREGLRLENESETPQFDEVRPYGLQIARRDSADWDSVNEVVLQLFRLAQTYDAVYDGWETPLIGQDEAGHSQE